MPAAASTAKKKARPLPPLGVSVKLGTHRHREEEAKSHSHSPQTAPQADFQDRPLQQERLEKAWYSFAQKQDSFLQQTLSHSNPTIRGEHGIVIHLENAFQEEKLNEIRQELIPFLRFELKHHQLELIVEIPQEDEHSRAFTPKEKLELLMKKNPSLAKLIDTLDLEME